MGVWGGRMERNGGLPASSPTPPPPTPLIYLYIFTHLNTALSPSISPPFLTLLSKITSYYSSSPPSCLFSHSLVSPLPCLPLYLYSPPSAPATIASFLEAVTPPPLPPSPNSAVWIFSIGGRKRRIRYIWNTQRRQNVS